MQPKKISLEVRVSAQLYQMTCSLGVIGLRDVSVFQGVSVSYASKIMSILVLRGYVERSVVPREQNFEKHYYELSPLGVRQVRSGGTKTAWSRVRDQAGRKGTECYVTADVGVWNYVVTVPVGIDPPLYVMYKGGRILLDGPRVLWTYGYIEAGSGNAST